MELFHAYDIEIIDEEFKIGDLKRSDKTAHVVMFDANGIKTDSRDFAFIECEEVYQAIRNSEELNLNRCFVKDLSISEYRSQYGLNINEVVEIAGISALNSFFDASHNIDFSFTTFKGESLSFKNSIFSCNELNFFQAKFESIELDFSTSRFHCKHVNFQYAKFLLDELAFRDVKFQSDTISFINCDFYDIKLQFTSTDFGNSNLAFQFARFGKGDISFEKTKFQGEKLDFSKVEFGDGRVDFRLADFGDGDVSFDESEIGIGKFRFRRAKFGKGRISFEMAQLDRAEISFDRTEFGNGMLSFYQCVCDTIDLSSSQLNNHIDLRVSHCKKIDLSSTIVRDIVDLSNDQGKVNIEQINLGGMRNLGRLFLDWYDNDVKRLIFNQKDTTVKMKAEQFRMLKEEFRALGQYTDEDKAYLEFKRLELKDRKERVIKKNKFNALWFYPIYWGEYLVFDQIGHYATNPMRVLVSMIISFIGITLMFILLILTTDSDIVSSIGDPDHLSIITKSIYHSSITFLTIGYGDYYPSGWIRWLSGIEGFVGLFLMSYFTVAFMRKVLR